MNTISPIARLLRLLLIALSAGSPWLWAQDEDATAPNPQASQAAEERAFRQAIDRLESKQGAYGAELSEQLLSLGLTLQSEGRHEEAISQFKRGAHLARINNGLYSQAQIPLIQGQIGSHIALGNYLAADERQQYMYKVQLRSMATGEPRTMALMQQANWQYQAYSLDIGENSFTRLMNMWDLYRLALNDIIALEGEDSANLLYPLRGMLRTQYLISGYKFDDAEALSMDDLGARQQLNRFNAYRSQSYEKGQAVVQSIYNIEREHQGENSPATANALSMLGDWQLWHNQKDAARQSYQDALAELAQADAAQVETKQLFDEPVALPNMDGVRPLPRAVSAEEGDILLEFGVSKKGRVVDLERTDENEVSASQANRLMRVLRRTRFRPRFEAGQPVGTQNIVRAYKIQ
jgi:hypothetical protein